MTHVLNPLGDHLWTELEGSLRCRKPGVVAYAYTTSTQEVEAG